MTEPEVIELRGQNSLDVFRINGEQDIIAWGFLIKGGSVFFVERIMELNPIPFSGCFGDLQEEADAKGSGWSMYSWQTAECFSSSMGLERKVEIPNNEEEGEKRQSGEDRVLRWIDHFAPNNHLSVLKSTQFVNGWGIV